MNRTPWRAPLLILMLLASLLVGCSSDDDPADPSGGGDQDTTAPVVVSISPASGQSGVDHDAPIVITFSEDMDPASADGQITLSAGAVTDLTWTTARILTVAHGAWDDGAAVTVTIGTGLADAAGNTLAAAHQTSFWVSTPDLVFLSSVPAAGAVDVNRSTPIALLFSAPMDQSSFAAAVTLTDELSNALAFTVHEDDDWMVITPEATLPAGTEIEVGVSTDAQDVGGRNLAAAVSFSFTTGIDVDTTPPTIIGFEPANGATVDASTSYLRITYSEPMRTDSAYPVRVNAELFLLAAEGEVEPIWSADRTTLTIALPTPLPAGLPMEMAFQGYQDAAGNAQSTATTWEATVAGTADYYPLSDGARFIYAEAASGGNVGDDTPLYDDNHLVYIQFEAAAGSVFHRTYYDAGFQVADSWDLMSRTATSMEILGFAEVDEGQTVTITFDSPLTWVPLPPAGTWTDATTATVPGEGTLDISVDGRFVSELDLPWADDGEDHPELFWKDVRLVVFEHILAVGEDTIEAGVDSLWLSPTVGIVKYGSAGEDYSSNEWWHEHGTLLPPTVR